MSDEPLGEGRGWELPIAIVLGWLAVAWIGWHERNVVGALGMFAFVAFVSVLFFVGSPPQVGGPERSAGRGRGQRHMSALSASLDHLATFGTPNSWTADVAEQSGFPEQRRDRAANENASHVSPPALDD